MTGLISFSYLPCILDPGYKLPFYLPDALITRSGLAQCTELCLQLRGEADKRQVENARVALQHNLGLGGAVVVALYKMGFQNSGKNSNQG